MEEGRHIEELVAENPCTGYYQHGWLVNAWMEERGWGDEEKKYCIHCKIAPGCPGCNDRLLKAMSIGSLTRWNPDVLKSGWVK